MVSEKDFMQQVIELMKIGHWDYYFTWNSIHSPPGFPDLVAAKEKLLLFAELKTENGRLLRSQQRWLETLAFIAEFSNGTMMVFLWRPSDYDEIKEVLLGKK